MSKRIVWMDQVRAIAMLFVIMGHVALTDEMNKYIYSFHMALFFIISGMTHRANKYESFGDCLKDKFKKLMIPHFVFQLLMLPMWLMNFKVLVHAAPSLKELIFGTFYINNAVYQTPSNATYFLAVLFIVEILFYLVEQYAQNREKLITVIIIIMGMIGFIESRNPSNYEGPWHMEVAFTAIVFYLLGWLFIRHIDKIGLREWNRGKYIGIIVVCALLGAWLANENGRVSFNGNSFDSILYFYLSAMLTSFAIILIVIKVPKTKLLTYIGQNTVMYLGIHIPFIRMFENSFVIFKEDSRIAFLLAIGLFIALVPVVFVVKKAIPFVTGKIIDIKKVIVFFGIYLACMIPYFVIIKEAMPIKGEVVVLGFSMNCIMLLLVWLLNTIITKISLHGKKTLDK